MRNPDPKKRTDLGARMLDWRLGAAVLAGVTGASYDAVAQSASPGLTPPGETALEASPSAQFSFPPAQGLTPPAGASNIEVTLTSIEVEGQFPELTAESDRLAAPLIGRSVSVSEVYAFAAELQQAYFAAGYPLARVVVPPQELGGDGVMRVLVVDGYIESADVSQLPEAVRARVARVLGPLVGQRRATRAKLERALLIAGDTAGLTLHSTLAPGNSVGGTVLVLSGRHDAVAGAVSIDNRVSEELGRWQATGSLVLNSSLGFGERIYALAAIPLDGDAFTGRSPRKYVSVGFEAPLGIDGVTWGAAADYSSTNPQGDVAAQRLHSEYSRVGVFLDAPIIRSRNGNLSARAAFDFVSDVESTRFTGSNVTLSADRTRVMRLGFDADVALGDGRLGGGITYSQGVDLFGARSAREATPLKPLSRDGADAEFHVLEASVSLAQPIDFGSLQVALSARGQYNFNQPLVRSEQFSPASWDGVSGMPPGSLVGDSGAVARAEVQRPIFFEAGEGGYVAPYAFVAAAETHLERPSMLERRWSDVSGVGVGMRFGIGQREERDGFNFTGSVEFMSAQSDRDDLEREWISASIIARF